MYTGYFSKLKQYQSKGLIPVGICGSRPNFYNGHMYTKLGPKYSFFKEWKYGDHKGDNDYYIEHFNTEVLNLLDVVTVCNELKEFGPLDNLILLCYESPTKFCHRHLVADWFKKAGIICEEFLL